MTRRKSARAATPTPPTTSPTAQLSDAALRRKQAECLHTFARMLRGGAEERYSAYVAWGSDSRYARCRLCGKVEYIPRTGNRGARATTTAPTTTTTPKRRKARASAAQLTLWKEEE